MKSISVWISTFLIITVLPLSACGQKAAIAENIPPVKLEPVDGTDFMQMVLTEKAFERLDIQTAPIREEQVNDSQQKVIPYAAVMYGLQGETWTYTNPEPLVFIRQPIVIDYIKGNLAYLLEGPDIGIEVVVVGAAELFGAEVGVSK
jgi:hypothetical protein